VPADFVFRTVTAWDGTELAYQSFGDGPGLPVVLANGLGGDYRAWRHIFARFGGERRLVTWDYRGLYRSGPPRTLHTLSPAAQARDLGAVVDALGWRRFVVIGWSMGVQVALEAWRRMSERIAGLGFINGVPGRPFDTALGSRAMRWIVPALLVQLRRQASLVARASSLATRWRGLLPTLIKLGLVGQSIDVELFAEFARAYASIDFELYGATLMALGRHDAWDVVPTVTVPLAFVTGDHDLLTPPSEARRVKAMLPAARLRILAGGTHYTPVELPDEVCHELGWLFARAEACEAA
jgi:pimeloyl-ACP methyl ester carboxylesterase